MFKMIKKVRSVLSGIESRCLLPICDSKSIIDSKPQRSDWRQLQMLEHLEPLATANEARESQENIEICNMRTFFKLGAGNESRMSARSELQDAKSGSHSLQVARDKLT